MQFPFSGNPAYSLEQAAQQKQAELSVLTSMAKPVSVFEEINKITSSLTDEEKSKILNSEEYKSAQALYETGFFAFLNGKFFLEYSTTKEGRIAGENLLEIISKLKTEVQEEVKKEKEKLAKLYKLMEQDPDLRKKLEEIK